MLESLYRRGTTVSVAAALTLLPAGCSSFNGVRERSEYKSTLTELYGFSEEKARKTEQETFRCWKEGSLPRPKLNGIMVTVYDASGDVVYNGPFDSEYVIENFNKQGIHTTGVVLQLGRKRLFGPERERNGYRVEYTVLRPRQPTTKE